MGKKKTIAAVVLTVLLVPVLSRGEYFVVMRNGNARSGPGTEYAIAGSVKASEVFEIPTSFTPRWDAKWIPIEGGGTPQPIKVKGWHPIRTQPAYVDVGEIVEGWYLVGVEDLRKVQPGETVVFIMEDDTETLYYGEVMATLPDKRILEGLLYKNAKFRVATRVQKEVEVKPEVGRFLRFYMGDCDGHASAGTLLKVFSDRKTCQGETYELGLFEVKPGPWSSFTKWIHVELGERVDELHLARKLYRIRTSGFSSSVQKDILENRIWIGMTKEMTRLSWGEPAWANPIKSSKGRRDQWVYNYGRTTYYLYFTDGKLDAYRKVGLARGR